MQQQEKKRAFLEKKKREGEERDDDTENAGAQAQQVINAPTGTRRKTLNSNRDSNGSSNPNNNDTSPYVGIVPTQDYGAPPMFAPMA